MPRDKPVSGGAPVAKVTKHARAAARGAAKMVDRNQAKDLAGGLEDMGDNGGEVFDIDRGFAVVASKASKEPEPVGVIKVMSDEGLDWWRAQAALREAREAKEAAEAKALADSKLSAKERAAKAELEANKARLAQQEHRLKNVGFQMIVKAESVGNEALLESLSYRLTHGGCVAVSGGAEANMYSALIDEKKARIRKWGFDGSADVAWGDIAVEEDKAKEAIKALRSKVGLPPLRDLVGERMEAQFKAVEEDKVAKALAPSEAVEALEAAVSEAAPVAKTYFKPAEVGPVHADHTLRIGDLPFDIQWGDLKALFDGVGVPFANRGCSIARDRNTSILSVDPKIKLRMPKRPTPWDDVTKSPKGGAFVKFDTHAQAERALGLLQGKIAMKCSYMGITKRPHIAWAATDSK
jgi:hypothetical protein